MKRLARALPCKYWTGIGLRALKSGKWEHTSVMLVELEGRAQDGRRPPGVRARGLDFPNSNSVALIRPPGVPEVETDFFPRLVVHRKPFEDCLRRLI